MVKEIIISGLGGQYITEIGKALAEAALAEGFHVSWSPASASERHDHISNCSVVLSDNLIDSPSVTCPDELIAMSERSVSTFESDIKPGGAMFINSSSINIKPVRTDILTYYIPCEEIAADAGNLKTAGMAMLGAYVEATKIIKAETIHYIMRNFLFRSDASLANSNIKAMSAGSACVR